MRKKKKKSKAIAIVTVHGVGKMTSRQRAKIATWLRKQGDWILEDGKLYTAGRFTARYS